MEDKQFADLVELLPRCTTAFQYTASCSFQSVASVEQCICEGYPVGMFSLIIQIKQVITVSHVAHYHTDVSLSLSIIPPSTLVTSLSPSQHEFCCGRY